MERNNSQTLYPKRLRRVIQRDFFHGLGFGVGHARLSWAPCALKQGKLGSEFKSFKVLKVKQLKSLIAYTLEQGKLRSELNKFKSLKV